MAPTSRSVCRSCRLFLSRSTTARAFATSSLRSIIPPESPNYIDIPQTHQPDFFPPRRPKGVLPIPREIFPSRQPDKPSAEYLARAIPSQTNGSTPNPATMSDYELYKTRMTTLRRSHLRSGLLELYNRKITMAGELAEKSSRRQTERTRLIHQPPREDERLTNTSTLTSTRITPGNLTHLRDPSAAAALHAQRKANTEAHTHGKAESRLDALHTLYMHARSFITTEAQLAAEIDHVFDDTKSEWGTSSKEGTNVWNREAPATIGKLLHERMGAGAGRKGSGVVTGRLASAIGHKEGQERWRTDQKRMKKIAEVLSGGKM